MFTTLALLLMLRELLAFCKMCHLGHIQLYVLTQQLSGTKHCIRQMYLGENSYSSFCLPIQ